MTKKEEMLGKTLTEMQTIVANELDKFALVRVPEPAGFYIDDPDLESSHVASIRILETIIPLLLEELKRCQRQL